MTKISTFYSVQRRNSGPKNANFFAWEADWMTSLGSNFVCGRPQGVFPFPPSTGVHLSLTPPPSRVDAINAFFLTLRLLCLTVLVLGALLSSFLDVVLHKCSIWMNEWIIYLCNSCNQVMGVETSAYIDMFRLPALELRWPLQGLMATTISNSCSLFCITWPTAQDITKESGYTQLHSKFLHHTAPGLVYFLH